MSEKFDPGFNKVIKWDIPLLEGYDFEFMKNISKDPGSHHYSGIINPDIINKIENWGAGSILIYGWNFNAHLKCINYFYKKIPVFFRGDSTDLTQRNSFIKKTIRRIFLTYVYQKIDRILYVGTQNKLYFLDKNCKEKNLVYAPHAIEINRFLRKPEFTLRSKFNISENDIVFLYAGKFEEVKNIQLLILAFSNFKNNNFQLLIIGNGPLELELKLFVSKLPDSVKCNIHFDNFYNQSNMVEVYKSADVFVLPSKSETWGLSVNEAMACGKAIIVSDKCGCYRDLVRINENGYVFNSNNLNSLKEKMLKMDSKSKVTNMGELSFEIIKSWNFENVAKSIELIVLECSK